MTNALEVKGLRKSYGEKVVLKGIDLYVRRGDIFALLGVNGAGKTTTLECIEGLRKYDGGTISVNGRIGIQLQSAALPAHIKGGEAVRLFAKWNRKTADASMLEALGADSIADKQYKEMSTGQKRRLHLALALICSPDIVFLDEPTAGLDIEGRISLHRLCALLRQHSSIRPQTLRRLRRLIRGVWFTQHVRHHQHDRGPDQRCKADKHDSSGNYLWIPADHRDNKQRPKHNHASKCAQRYKPKHIYPPSISGSALYTG